MHRQPISRTTEVLTFRTVADPPVESDPLTAAKAIAGALSAWGSPVITEPADKPAPRSIWLPRKNKWLRTEGKKIRSGHTKNHSQGQSKARRQMVKASRKRNRV